MAGLLSNLEKFLLSYTYTFLLENTTEIYILFIIYTEIYILLFIL